MLKIRNLTVHYGTNTCVLRDLSLKVNPRERVAVLGASGAGKTTLFRAINGFVKPSSGSICVDDLEVTSLDSRQLRALRSRIGVISQSHDLIDALSVHQNVMAGALGRWSSFRALRYLFMPTAAELDEARSVLRKVGLEHKLRVRAATLSGGEHQRIAIARALVQCPVLLLADEPIASLDPARSEQILRLICGLAAETNVSLLCSLHIPELAYRFFDRVVELCDGQIKTDRSLGTWISPSESSLARANA